MDILDLFYNHVVKEAATGRVVCDLYYNILFETYIKETNEKTVCAKNYDGVVIPVLTINNKSIFDELLIKYVELWQKFDDVSDYQLADVNEVEKKYYKICNEKIILTLLWSNATFEDFQDPISFLYKRIAFLENELSDKNYESGYSPMLDGSINIRIEKDVQETPFSMVISVKNNQGQMFIFPEISFGIANDIVYIYAIQNHQHETDSYVKKVNRILYKIGEGFNPEADNYELYKEGNLKDITPSFLVALNIAISYFNSLGYTKFCAPSILISRWNAKKIATHYMLEYEYINEDKKQELLIEQDKIQHNLTEKFLRTFLRLSHHYESISVDSYPFDGDSHLHISVDGELISNNSLLQETADLAKINNKNKKI